MIKKRPFKKKICQQDLCSLNNGDLCPTDFHTTHKQTIVSQFLENCKTIMETVYYLHIPCQQRPCWSLKQWIFSLYQWCGYVHPKYHKCVATFVQEHSCLFLCLCEEIISYGFEIDYEGFSHAFLFYLTVIIFLAVFEELASDSICFLK